MSNPKLLIVGGGLAGLSAGCYARVNNFDVTIVEHNLELGGVCTAWHRGPYLIDGCIHWLTGGPFQQIYEELGIIPAVPLRTLEEFVTYRHARDGWEATLSRDMKKTADSLRALAPEDADELARMVEGAEHAAALGPPMSSGRQSWRPPAIACATSGGCGTTSARSFISANRFTSGLMSD